MKISIGTKSELKVRAVENALKKLSIKAEIVFGETESGVSMQPFGFDEITKGAKQRALQAITRDNADYGVGIESGIVEIKQADDSFDTACVCVISRNKETSFSFSTIHFVPKDVLKEIKEKGTEFGKITIRFSGDKEKDNIKYFSDGALKREEFVSQAVACAFIKFIKTDKYIYE
ncbi:MAG: inosine/xanthosine triphosphatase [Candidatus Taylorbacteria bacterium]|nr:inosine/xanthosine triphosphatase [Candidatus Taylorbacteria bacterium]